MLHKININNLMKNRTIYQLKITNFQLNRTILATNN